ncbi:MAG: iron ABC transporter substrate-binding protein [Chloroflexi bacterium]|nr:iron ABC transporter substrate-binding protein [Chloroflexota bacterium]
MRSFLHLRPAFALVTLVIATAVVAACGADPTATPTAAPVATPTPAPMQEGSGSLVIYSGRSESLVDPIIQQFADVTGIDVEIKYGGTASLAATLLEEGTNSPADVFYAQDPGGLGAVESLLSPLPSGILERAPDWAQSPQGLWTGISGRARVLVYSPDRVPESELPADIFDLTDPKWKGRVGWAPTNGSFLTMVTGMRKLWGEEKTAEWIEGMVANNAVIYPKNTPQVAAVAAGEIDIGLVNHYYLYRFVTEEGEDFPARNYHPSGGGPGALIMVSGAGILSTTENRENAERFIEFLLGTVAQQYFAGQTFEYPLVEGVNINRLLTPLDEIARPDIALADLSDLEGTTAILRDLHALP